MDIRLDIHKHGVFHTTPGYADVLQQGFAVHYFGNNGPGKGGVSDIPSILKHGFSILHEKPAPVNLLNDNMPWKTEHFLFYHIYRDILSFFLFFTIIFKYKAEYFEIVAQWLLWRFYPSPGPLPDDFWGLRSRKHLPDRLLFGQ
jgi:hypothetical protein